MDRFDLNSLKKFAPPTVLFFVLVGLFLRLWRINQSDFIFFDEGYYLNFNIRYLYIIQKFFPQNWADFWQAFWLCMRVSLGTGKAMWFAIVDSRVFLGLLETWWVPRVVSAVAGVLTLGLCYQFARRWSNSGAVAALSVVLLSILPSHVFYSRIAIQETVCVLFFLSGLYLYLFSARLGGRTIASAVLLSAAYFSNYRLIIIPVLVAVAEIWSKFSVGQWPDIRKYVWHTVVFLALMVLIGNLDQAQNTIVTFSWMFHQAHLGEERFDWFNFLSYPYCLFRLEHGLFGIFFFGNVYFLFRKRYSELLPFALAVTQMFMFSFAADKAARYLSVVMPFLAMGVAVLIVAVFQESHRARTRWVLGLGVAFMIAGMTVKSFQLANFRSAYRSSMEFLLSHDPNVKVLSTQNWVQNLYTPRRTQVWECPHQFGLFVKLFSEGFRVLIVDPQAYISYTADGKKFTSELGDYLGFVVDNVKPLAVYPHFSPLILERFVLEHNENLKRSLLFLRDHGADAGILRVYSMDQCMLTIQAAMNSRKH